MRISRQGPDLIFFTQQAWNNITKNCILSTLGRILGFVNEFEKIWSNLLLNAADGARQSGRTDLVNYLDLRIANDKLRQISVAWLLDSFTDALKETEFSSFRLKTTRVEPHNFEFRRANIVGAQVQISHGIRCISIEAGWTRTPKDGFIRGGALAIGRIKHFGKNSNNAELALIKSEIPEWHVNHKTGAFDIFRLDHIRQHLRVLVS